MAAVRIHSGPFQRFSGAGARKHPRQALVPPCDALALKSVGYGNWADLGVDAKDAPTTIDLSRGGLFTVGAEDKPSRPLDVIIDVPTVSGLHAKLKVLGGDRILVTDLGSTNGTTVNGKPVKGLKPYGVVPGDVIVFGDDQFAKYEVVSTDTAGGVEGVSVPTNVDDARSWIAAWRNSQKLSGDESSDTAGLSSVDEARAWIAAYKSRK